MSSESDVLFKVADRLKKFAGAPQELNEDGTRAFFIDKWLDALGYSDFDDLEHGSAVASGDFPDYILRSSGVRVAAVEAKRIGHPLGAKEAAQVVKYTSVLGLRWGLLTDGRLIRIYDVPVTGATPEERLVLTIDLADFADREDFDSRIWPTASLLTKEALDTGEGLENYAARELIRKLLTTPGSATLGALRRELLDRKVVLTREHISDLVDELLG
jgi:predicted type IV restriction endonuclease